MMSSFNVELWWFNNNELMDGGAAGWCPSWRTWWPKKGSGSPTASRIPTPILARPWAQSSNSSPSSRPPLGRCLVKHAAAACFAEWVEAVENDRRPMNKTQTCLFCAILSKWCISNEVFAVSCFCLLINETFLLAVLFLAREVTGKREEKAVNWAGLGSVCFTMVLI